MAPVIAVLVIGRQDERDERDPQSHLTVTVQQNFLSSRREELNISPEV